MKLHGIESPFDLHTPAQRAFLSDENENCKTYADGTAAADAPRPVTLSWDADAPRPVTLSWDADAPGPYVVRIGEKPDFSDARTIVTDACSLDVYNLKINTRYYFTVGNEQSATFVTADAPPRNLSVGGVMNARDLGGWKTTDGKRVKQGLIFRTSALDSYDDGTGKTTDLVTPAGKSTLTDLIGIRTEIDLRRDHESESGYPPEGITESTLGEGVRYLHCPILLGPENYLNSVESLRRIFSTLADPQNYPVAYHCRVGADRTGAISYLILGLLGVGDDDLMRDYLFTNFSRQGFYRPPINRGYKVTIDQAPGKTTREKIGFILTERIGIPQETLDKVAANLTE